MQLLPWSYPCPEGFTLRGLRSAPSGKPLLHFLHELQACPGAPALQPGEVVTTGTWTDAWPIAPGQVWRSEFDAPFDGLEVTLR